MKPIPLPTWWAEHRGEWVAVRPGYGREELVAHHEDPRELVRILKTMGDERRGVVMERVPHRDDPIWMGGGLEITYPHDKGV